MHPILFTVGTFPIHTYGAAGAFAFLVGAGLSIWRAVRLGLNRDQVADVIFWMSISSLLGARLVFVLQNPGEVHGFADFFDLRGGGLVFYGAFIVGIPVGFAMMWRYSLPPFAVFDCFGTAFPIAHGISRLGCYAAGCCYGAPTDVGWAVTFPEGHALAPGGVALHPVQLYEAAALLAIGFATNAFYARRRFDGQVFLLYLVLYAIARALLETFRGDIDRGWFLPELLGQVMTFSQGMSLVFALVALVVFSRGRARVSAG